VGASRHAWVTTPGVVRALGDVERWLAAIAAGTGAQWGCHAQLLSPRSKRLRPAIVLLAARCGGAPVRPEAVRAAAAVELLHEATLYHDDIVDEAPVRRGRPSACAAAGAAAAALAGSELLYASVELLADLPVALRRAVGRAGERLCRGQVRELELVGQCLVSVPERIRVMRDKTATLFELAARLGAALGGLDPGEVARLTRYGRLFGLAYQLADDLRDLCVRPEELGRAPFADLRDGVYTLPVLYALRGRGLSATVLRCLLGRYGPGGTEPEAERIVSVIRAGGGIRMATMQLRAWVDAALAALPRGHVDGSAAADLRRLTEGLALHSGAERDARAATVEGPVAMAVL